MCPAHNEITGIPQVNGAQLIFLTAAFLMMQQLSIKHDITAHKYCTPVLYVEGLDWLVIFTI